MSVVRMVCWVHEQCIHVSDSMPMPCLAPPGSHVSAKLCGISHQDNLWYKPDGTGGDLLGARPRGDCAWSRLFYTSGRRAIYPMHLKPPEVSDYHPVRHLFGF